MGSCRSRGRGVSRQGKPDRVSGELRFRERSVDGGTKQYISAVGHIEFLNGRPPEENRDRLAGDSAPGTDDIPLEVLRDTVAHSQPSPRHT
jgi:hypothetical protein